VSFAHGELAADRQWRALAPTLRRAGVIVAAVVLAQTLLACGQWGWYAWQKKSLQQQIRQQIQPWAPQAVAGSSALPMLRAVDRLRVSRGLPARDDMVTAMAQLAEVNRGQLKLVSLRYDSGRLAFQAPALTTEQAQAWQAQLAARQWLLSSSQNEQGQREWVLTREPA
jgi:general secretion pathway protein L